MSVSWHHSLVDAHADEEQGLEWCVRAFPENMVVFSGANGVFFLWEPLKVERFVTSGDIKLPSFRESSNTITIQTYDNFEGFAL